MIPSLAATEGCRPYASVVLPVFRNSDTLIELYHRLCSTFESMALSRELIIVDDACPDYSWQTLAEHAKDDPTLAIVVLERNVGQHTAVLTGLGLASGERAVVMDADLQDPPEMIPQLLSELGRGCQAVFAGRRGRYESLPRILTSRVYKGLLRMLTGLPADAGLFVALSGLMVEELLSFDVANPHVVSLIGCTGLPTLSIPFRRPSRPSGKSSYHSGMRLASAGRALRQAVKYRRTPHVSVPVRRFKYPAIRVVVGRRFLPAEVR